ncbi:MAG: FtsX-like permease family protein [Eubacteriales bacterium]|nr:FtsX-like permease family protein [Eubacteriales bacterium]
MTKRKMYLRMVTAALLRRRSRMLIALLSIAIGATILSGLLTIYYDVPRQMGAQFRGYGANMLFMADSQEGLTMSGAIEALKQIHDENLVGASPYKYIRVDMISRQQSFTAAGTDFEQIQKTSPYFQIEGAYPEGRHEVLIGKQVAETIGSKIGDIMELTYVPTTTSDNQEETGAEELSSGGTLYGNAIGWDDQQVSVTVTIGEDQTIKELIVDASKQTEDLGGQCAKSDYTDQYIGKSIPVDASEIDAISGATLTSNAVTEAINHSHSKQDENTAKTVTFKITGILDTGGDEEGYVFMSMSDMGDLTGSEEALDVMELSVSATQEELENYVTVISQEDNLVNARLVKRVTHSETAVLSKLQALVFLVTAVVLLLIMICVSTTMTAVVSERRREIGLRKALGASDNSIRMEFLGEGMFLGLLGGLLGGILGFVFAQVVSIQVFGSSITLQPLLLPLAVIVSMVIAALSCLLPVKHAVAIDPALVLKGE